jgi:hypothetical protein
LKNNLQLHHSPTMSLKHSTHLSKISLKEINLLYSYQS